jgi:hypothetical protein
MAARQVILYFDDQQDALRFALAAGSVMSGDGQTGELIQETQRASRIRVEEVRSAASPENSRPEKMAANPGTSPDARAPKSKATSASS